MQKKLAETKKSSDSFRRNARARDFSDKSQGPRRQSLKTEELGPVAPQSSHEKREAKNLFLWRVPNENTREQVPDESGECRPSPRKTKQPRGQGSDDEGINRDRSRKLTVSRSASSLSNGRGRSPVSRQNSGKSDERERMKAHTWNNLFHNFHRAVDEIYHMCELDGNIVECEEALRQLQLCQKDFQQLIERFQLEEKFEKQPGQPIMDRRAVAWEVRKSSPMGRRLSNVSAAGRLSPRSFSPDLERSRSNISLGAEEKPNFSGPEQAATAAAAPSSDVSDPFAVAPVDPNCNMDPLELSSSSQSSTEATKSESAHPPLSSRPDSAAMKPEFTWAQRVARSIGVSPVRERELHQKLSSPDRKRRNPEETRRLQDERQARAQEIREKLEADRQDRVRASLNRIKEVSERVEQGQTRKKNELEEKLERAEELHEARLQEIVRKAESENSKVSEVAFITTLSNENAKLALQKKVEDSEARRQERLEEIRRKQKEEEDKKHAVLGRRKKNESERLHKIMSKEERAREAQQKLAEERKQALALREAKAELQARRVEEMNRNQQAAVEKLERKLSQRLEESSIRHSQYIEQIKEKAVAVIEKAKEVAQRDKTPREKTPSESPTCRRLYKRLCKVCNVEIVSDEYLASHLAGKKHIATLQKARSTDQDADNCIVTVAHLCSSTMKSASFTDEDVKASKERELRMRKRAKKLRQRLSIYNLEFEEGASAAECSNKARLSRIAAELPKLLAKKNVDVIEPLLVDLARVLEGKKETDVVFVRQSGCIAQVVAIATRRDLPSANNRAAAAAIRVLLAFFSIPDNRTYALASRLVLPVIDFTAAALSHDDPFLPQLVHLLTILLRQPLPSSIHRQIRDDIFAYVVSVGLVDRIKDRFRKVPRSDSTSGTLTAVAEKSISLLEALTSFAELREKPVFEKTDVGSWIVSSFHYGCLHALFSLLTSTLLQGAPLRSAQAVELRPSIIVATSTAIKLLNNIALLDLPFLQECIGGPDMVTEFFHLISFLLNLCSASSSSNEVDEFRKDLLHEIILLLGYSCLHNPTNQRVLQWGKSPTILQLLANLPFCYFSDPRYKNVLFPSLVAICFSNLRNYDILQTEVSAELLATYISEYRAKAAGQSSAPSALPVDPSVPSSSKSAPVMLGGASSVVVPGRFQFANRFPPQLWEAAEAFFRQPHGNTPPARPQNPSDSDLNPAATSDLKRSAPLTNPSTDPGAGHCPEADTDSELPLISCELGSGPEPESERSRPTATPSGGDGLSGPSGDASVVSSSAERLDFEFVAISPTPGTVADNRPGSAGSIEATKPSLDGSEKARAQREPGTDSDNGEPMLQIQLPMETTDQSERTDDSADETLCGSPSFSLQR